MTEREIRIMLCRLEEGLTLEKTGKIFGVTRERIRQIEAKALMKIEVGSVDNSTLDERIERIILLARKKGRIQKQNNET